MRILNLLLITVLFSLSGMLPFSAYAADSAIKVTSIAEVEIEVSGAGGKKLQRKSVERAVPGTEVIYTNTFQNTLKKPAGNIVIDNAIPNDSEYKAGSSFGKNCDIQFSVDGGKTFRHAEDLKVKDMEGKERTALAREYTNIRWTYKGQLAPGKSGEVGFRATIK